MADLWISDFGLCVKDFERSIEFSTTLFDLEELKRGDDPRPKDSRRADPRCQASLPPNSGEQVQPFRYNLGRRPEAQKKYFPEGTEPVPRSTLRVTVVADAARPAPRTASARVQRAPWIPRTEHPFLCTGSDRPCRRPKSGVAVLGYPVSSTNRFRNRVRPTFRTESSSGGSRRSTSPDRIRSRCSRPPRSVRTSEAPSRISER